MFGAIITAAMLMVAVFVNENSFGKVFAVLSAPKVGLLRFFRVVIKRTFEFDDQVVIQMITDCNQCFFNDLKIEMVDIKFDTEAGWIDMVEF